MELATMIRSEFPGRSLSGIGGVETGSDAAQFILLGANTVQVCTGVMKFGYELIKPLCEGLLAFMEKHKFETLDDFRGHSLDYFTTHAELVRIQEERKAGPKVPERDRGIRADGDWSRRKVRRTIRRPEPLIAAHIWRARSRHKRASVSAVLFDHQRAGAYPSRVCCPASRQAHIVC